MQNSVALHFFMWNVTDFLSNWKNHVCVHYVCRTAVNKFITASIPDWLILSQFWSAKYQAWSCSCPEVLRFCKCSDNSPTVSRVVFVVLMFDFIVGQSCWENQKKWKSIVHHGRWTAHFHNLLTSQSDLLFSAFSEQFMFSKHLHSQLPAESHYPSFLIWTCPASLSTKHFKTYEFWKATGDIMMESILLKLLSTYCVYILYVTYYLTAE